MRSKGVLAVLAVAVVCMALCAVVANKNATLPPGPQFAPARATAMVGLYFVPAGGPAPAQYANALAQLLNEHATERCSFAGTANSTGRTEGYWWLCRKPEEAPCQSEALDAQSVTRE